MTIQIVMNHMGINKKFIDEPLVIAETAVEVIDILETKLKGK